MGSTAPFAQSRDFVAALVRDLLSQGIVVRLVVTGTSMAPCIRSGDVVTLVPPPARGARRGDVVAVAPCPERLLVHRLVARTEAGFVTSGDAAAGSDGASESILGIVSRVERNGRPVWFGLGPERVWVAWAQRRGWLRPLRSTVARLAEAVGLRTVSAGRVSGVRGAA